MKVPTIVTVLVAVLAAAPLQAQTEPGFEVGVQVFDYRYRERFDGATVARDRGTFVGLDLAYALPLGGGWSFTVRAQGATAEVDYRADDGSRIDDVSQNVGRFELLVARDLPVGRGAVLTPSLGLAARLLEDRSGSRVASDGSAGYDRDVFYTYLPAGLALGVPVGGRTRLELAARYGRIVGGHVESRLSGADPSLPDLTLDLNGGSLLEAEATVRLPVGRHAVVLGPFVRRWRTGRSDSRRLSLEGVEVEFFEPRTATTEAGLRAAFRF